MTEPVVAQKIQVSGYTGVQAGIESTPLYRIATENNIRIKSDSHLDAGAVLGGEANYKGTFARAEVGLGTALSGKVELGHTFDIGRNMGLELSAKAQTSRSLIGKNQAYVRAEAVDISDTMQLRDGAEAGEDWSSGVKRLGAAAKLTFGSKKVKFGVGFESGIAKGSAPDTNLNVEAHANNNHASAEMSIRNKTEYYGTPTVSADIKLGKKLSFNANADLNQGHIGVRYNF